MSYRHLRKEKKHYKGKTQPIDLKILPANGKQCTCTPSTFLDSAGKPQRCRRPGYVQIGEEVFCKDCCFIAYVKAAEILLKPIAKNGKIKA